MCFVAFLLPWKKIVVADRDVDLFSPLAYFDVVSTFRDELADGKILSKIATRLPSPCQESFRFRFPGSKLVGDLS